MDIKLFLKSQETVDMRQAIGDVEYGDLINRCEEAEDPFEVIALELLESQELPYVSWIEIDGKRKEEPFDYPGVPRWWEDDWKPPEVDPEKAGDPTDQGAGPGI